MRVALLLGERPARLDALLRVGDRPVERVPSGAEAERRDHQTRVAEHLLRLHEPLALHAADEPVGVDTHVVDEERGGVAQTEAVLVLVLAVREAVGVAIDDEPGRATGSKGEHRVQIRDTAVADPLLLAVEHVGDDAPVIHDGRRGRLQRGEVAAGFGLRGPVRHQEALVGEARHPVLALVASTADADRIATEERREHRGGHPDVDAGHPIAHPGDVEGTATHAAVLLFDEQQLDAELLAAHAPHEIGGKLVLLVQLDQARVGELA